MRSLCIGLFLCNAALPTANAGQYATSHCKPLLFWLRCIVAVYYYPDL